MGEWECAHCGYIPSGDVAPERCPECGTQRSFVFFAYPDTTAWEEEDWFIGLEIPDLPPYVEEESSANVEKARLAHAEVGNIAYTDEARPGGIPGSWRAV